MKTEHFQAPLGVIIFESIQIENKQVVKPTTQALTLTAWLPSKLYVIRQLKCTMKMIIQTQHIRESSCNHCKTAVLIGENVVAFLACHFGNLWSKYYYLACHKRFEHFVLNFGINQCLDS